MTELVITRGLPASGKTTYANLWVREASGRARVNRDDLRFSLFGIYWGLTYDQEQIVTDVQRAAVRSLVERGRSVIVDDTNLRLAHAKEWAKLARELGVDFRVEDVKTLVGVCVERDRERGERGERSVGEDVIRSLADRYGLHGGRWFDPVEVPPAGPAGRVYEPDETLPACWIVDLDGTLAHLNGRSPYDWGRVGEDVLDVRVDALIRDLRAAPYHPDVVVISGRDGSCLAQTQEWLARHGVAHDALFMRPAGDRRKDAVVKEEMFWASVAPDWNVLGVLDDRDQVVAMWRSLGLFCLQVAPGAF